MSEALRQALKQSSTQEKELAFAHLAKEFFQKSGHGTLAIADESKRVVGYIMDELQETELLFPKLTDQEETELGRRAAQPGECLTTEEFIAALDRE